MNSPNFSPIRSFSSKLDLRTPEAVVTADYHLDCVSTFGSSGTDKQTLTSSDSHTTATYVPPKRLNSNPSSIEQDENTRMSPIEAIKKSSSSMNGFLADLAEYPANSTQSPETITASNTIDNTESPEDLMEQDITSAAGLQSMLEDPDDANSP